MRNRLTASCSQFLICHPKVLRPWKMLPMLLFGVTLSWANLANAQAAPDAPPELLQALTQIDAAASQGKLSDVMGFYSPEFRNSDGLTYTTLQETLAELWKLYPRLAYSTQLNTWRREGSAIIAETTTSITTRPADTTRPAGAPARPATASPATANPATANIVSERAYNLTATITSRQRFENQKIVQQEILKEESQLTSGENPPSITVSLPEQVKVGQRFDFDVVVAEPLGDRLLLGAALEEPVRAGNTIATAPVELELLSSGGLFKVGRAPLTPETHWVSAMIVRDDGITTITRRLPIVVNGTPNR